MLKQSDGADVEAKLVIGKSIAVELSLSFSNLHCSLCWNLVFIQSYRYGTHSWPAGFPYHSTNCSADDLLRSDNVRPNWCSLSPRQASGKGFEFLMLSKTKNV